MRPYMKGTNMKFIAPSAIREPSLKFKKSYFEFYKKIKSSAFDDFKKNQIMTHVLGHERWSFRVTGVSVSALKEIKKSGYRHPGGGLLERDHIVRRRADTCKHIFSNEMPFNEWWEYIWDGDQTHLVTKKENRSNEESSEIIPLNWQEGYFEDAGIGFKCRVRTEGVMVRELCLTQGL